LLTSGRPIRACLDALTNTPGNPKLLDLPETAPGGKPPGQYKELLDNEQDERQ
jgi:hypothetical protein